MKQSLTREDAAFPVMKEQPAKGGTVLPQTAAVFVRHQQLIHALK